MAHDGRYRQYENIPIPTYDEAISSRPSSSVGPHGGDEAERQGLLGQADGGYRPPAVESPRNSEDSDLQLPEVNGADDERRQVEELDYLDPSAPDTSRRSPRLYHRARLRGRGKWSQQLSSIGATLSSIRIPSLRSLYTPVRPAERTEEAQPDPRTWLTRTTQRLRIPEQYRMSAPTAARLCGLFTLMALVYILFAMDIFPGTRHRNGGAHFDPESVRAFVQDNIDGETIKSFLAHITSFDHVAGTEGDLYLAKWMQEYWEQAAGFDQMDLLSYHVYLDYPGDRSVTLMGPTSPGWTATLEEDMVYKDRQQTLTWHGHSKSGEAEGHLLFANGGSRDDFQYLRDQGIVTEGAIALVRYGGTEGDGALKIKAAEEAGCVGVLMYSDPFSVDPAGAWQPTDDMVQRGGVSAMSWVVGDPLTPGYASTKHAKRVSKEDNPGLPKIPSIPLAWRDAKVLISALEKHGVEVPPNWLGGPSHTDFIQWYSGNASSRAADAVPSIRLKNVNEENDRQQIWNLHGLIEGLETPQKKIIVGAHRDAWCFGSVDAGSATAVMMEIVRIFGELRNIGWRPLRTIEFVSWDAEAYNLVGSTEYVEEHADVLREHGVAYINVDAGVYGPRFRASGSPLWERALFHVLDRVDDPSGPGSIKTPGTAAAASSAVSAP
ncbi:Transferrin receptor-like dimerization domain, partial [Teratosphaeria destructans]